MTCILNLLLGNENYTKTLMDIKKLCKNKRPKKSHSENNPYLIRIKKDNHDAC
jgi:hypothetical protein